MKMTLIAIILLMQMHKTYQDDYLHFINRYKKELLKMISIVPELYLAFALYI